MRNIIQKTYSLIKNIKNNIAFYPTVLASFGFVFALLMIWFEERGISKYLIDAMPMLVIEDGDTALNVLSVCIGGLISMMVFSFSMVMLLLSQASSNFSPRLLPGLISDKRHQSILGLYLGTIIYNIFTMFSIEPTGEKFTLPGFSVLLGILATILCLGAFIYFIHNMSQSIQISMILDAIYDTSKKRLSHIIDCEKDIEVDLDFPDSTKWHTYKPLKAGYFQHLSISNTLDFCHKHQVKLHILKPKGLFVLTNEIFVRSNKELTQEQLEAFYGNIYFSKRELVEDNYTLAFKQITEIAVKAMSPGINDPGTAVNAIDYLTDLLALRMQKKDLELFTDANCNVHFKLEIVSFKNLVNNVMMSLQTYSKHDPIILQKLLSMLTYLTEQTAVNADYKKIVENYIEILMEDVNKVLKTKNI